MESYLEVCERWLRAKFVLYVTPATLILRIKDKRGRGMIPGFLPSPCE